MNKPAANRIVKFARDPYLQHLELRYSHYRQEAFQKHTHDTYSIAIVKAGRTRFSRYGHAEVIHNVNSGDIVFINPGEVHACNPQAGSVLTYYMLYLEPVLLTKILTEVTRTIEGSFAFSAPLIRDDALYCKLDTLCSLLFEANSLLEVESNLIETLSEIALKYGTRKYRPVEAKGIGQKVRKSYDYLMENLSRNVSLQELAAICDLSPYHFLRAFRSQFGLPPHTCQLQQRINRARRLLTSGQPIAQVAADTGFADQSHFTRKFKAFVGATPRQYQTTSSGTGR